MCEITGFPFISQKKENDCWVACASMLFEYLTGESAPAVNSERDKQGSAIALLDTWLTEKTKKDYSKEFQADSHAVMTLEEIRKQITGENNVGKPMPILCCTAKKKPDTELDKRTGRYEQSLEVQNGHWIIITGVNEGAGTIQVADPGQSGIEWVKYNKEKYLGVLYWHSSTYTDIPV